MFNLNDENPYQSPANVDRYMFDHSLAWRMIKTFAIIFTFMFICDIILVSCGFVTNSSYVLLRQTNEDIKQLLSK